jgi:glycerol-3-phosphate O-acyltransferase
VWTIRPGQHLAAAYYRNTVIHYFVTGAIAELALLRAAEDGVADRRREFLEEALRLRDLLKFEFFFTEKDVFREELAAEMAFHDEHWEKAFEEGPVALAELVARIKPLSAHRVLRPFVEAYRVVADALLRHGDEAAIEEERFLRECLALGRQYVLQRRISRQESVSKVIFKSAFELARNRGLCDAGTPELGARRRAFAHELRETIRRIEGVQALVRARQAGVQI